MSICFIESRNFFFNKNKQKTKLEKKKTKQIENKSEKGEISPHPHTLSMHCPQCIQYV